MNRWVRVRRTLSLSAAMIVAGLWAGAGHAQEPRPVAHGLIIKLKEGASAQSLESDADRAAKRRERLQGVVRDVSRPGAAVQRVRSFARIGHHLDFGKELKPDEVERLMAQLRARPDVEWVEPNTRERRLMAPNDPGFSPGFCPKDDPNCTSDKRVPQWWMYAVGGSNSNALVERRRGVPGFETAWNRMTGLASAPVAVLDTGIVGGHPELAGRVLTGYDFVGDSVYANDGRGTAGINWIGRIVPVRVAGKCGADVDDIVEGMYWAAGLPACLSNRDANGACPMPAPINPNPVRIINISFGGSGSCNVYQTAIDDLRAAGVVIVAAAGNEQGAVTRPAKCPGVVGVGAVNRDGFKANYSNFGPELTVSTVGGDPKSEGNWATLGDEGILGLDISGAKAATGYGYASLFGSSFSAPIVAGTVSLMLSVTPALTHQQIVDGLRFSARPHVTSTEVQLPVCSTVASGRCICTTATCGAGLLDAEQALIYAQSPPEGGGALQPAWLLALALLTLLLACAPRARHAVRRARL